MSFASYPAGFAFAALMASVSASSGFALTADELWAETQRFAVAADVTLTATTRREGDRLVLTDIVIPVGPADDRAYLKLERIDLQELAGGKVAVLLPPEFPVNLDMLSTTAEVDLVTLTASAPDFSLVIAGLGETAEFDLSAPSLGLSLDKVLPELGAGDRLTANLAIADLYFQHRMDLTASVRTVLTSLRLGTLHGDVFFDVEEAGGSGSFALDLSGVTGGLDVTIPPSIEQPDPAGKLDSENPFPFLLRALEDGFSVSMDFSHGPFAFLVDFESAEENGKIKLTADLGALNGGFGADAAFYDVTLGKTQVAVSGNIPDLQYPNITMGVDEISYGVSAGIGDLVSPQEARLWARLIDLRIPAEILAEADPYGIVGSEPISYNVDVSAQYAVPPEMLKPDWKPVPNEVAPVDILEVTLNELMFRGAGVTLDGDGSLTFDKSDMTTYDGIPAPEGKLGFTATGVNALIDRLVAAGLVPPDELTAFRLGLMAIAKAGETPDSLVSNIEFLEKGMFLNGMKIR